MGIRSAAYLCQRVTTAIGYIFNNLGYNLIMYIDDLASCTHESQASQAYDSLGNLLSNLGVMEAKEKACPPCRTMEFLGVLFDINTMTMSVTEDRIIEILQLIEVWLGKRRATKQQLQSLIGKLQFVAKCVRAGRVFISRLLHILPTLRQQHHRFYVNAEIKKDLLWWRAFLRKFNGITVIPDMVWSAPDALFATDACLVSLGGWCQDQFFSCKFPPHVLHKVETKEYHINILELMAIMVALKLWAHKLINSRVQVLCDNLASVTVLNTGRTKDKVMLALMREIVYLCCKYNCQIRLVHISTKDNTLSDYLSRAPTSTGAANKLNELIDPTWTKVQADYHLFDIDNIW
jgi:hypothetical protein